MPKVIRRFTYKNSNAGWGDIKYIDFYDDGGCYYVYVDGSKKDIGDSYTIKTCEDLCQGNDNWKEVPVEGTSKVKVRRFVSAKDNWVSGVIAVDINIETGHCYFLFKDGTYKNTLGMYSLENCLQYVKEGSWKEVDVAQPLEGITPSKYFSPSMVEIIKAKEAPKKKRVYGEVKASDNHYHRILVRKGTKAIVKNSNTYYKSKYFVVDILTGKIDYFALTLKEAKNHF